MKEKLILFGAGGVGRDMLFVIEDAQQFEVLGFVDDTPALQGKTVGGKPVLGDTNWLLQQKEKIAVAICIANSQARKNIYEVLSANCHLYYPNIFAKDIICPKNAIMGQGCMFSFSNIVMVDPIIGDFLMVSISSRIGHDASIGSFVTIYPNVNLSGNVTVGDCTEIGTGAKIIPKKNIGKNVIIGAGAVVTKDIPDNCTAVGIPAKTIAKK